MSNCLSEKEVQHLLEMLQGDLSTLFELIVRHRQPLSQANVRAASSILRKWVCEDKIGYIANRIRAPLTVPVLDNAVVLKTIEQRTDIVFFATMGIHFDGCPVIGPYYATSPAQQKPLLPCDEMDVKFVKIAQFLKQKRIYFEGETISCREIITFIANKMGGVHVDMGRDERDLFLERAAKFMMFGGPRTDAPEGAEIYLKLEREGYELLNAFHAEVTAAAGSFVQLHIDGKPLLRLSVRQTIKDKLLNLFNTKKKLIHNYIILN